MYDLRSDSAVPPQQQLVTELEEADLIQEDNDERWSLI